MNTNKHTHTHNHTHTHTGICIHSCSNSNSHLILVQTNMYSITEIHTLKHKTHTHIGQVQRKSSVFHGEFAVTYIIHIQIELHTKTSTECIVIQTSKCYILCPYVDMFLLLIVKLVFLNPGKKVHLRSNVYVFYVSMCVCCRLCVRMCVLYCLCVLLCFVCLQASVLEVICSGPNTYHMKDILR